MSKVNTNKTSSFEPIRTARQSDVKQAGKSETQAIGNKTAISGDKLEFSNRIAETGKFLDQLKDLPDVREEKIESLRGQIASGDFNPSSETIADAILKDEN